MTKYREILRLSSLNLSQQNIADSCNVSKKTVNRVLKRAKELGISWPLDANETDAVLTEKFFPSAKQVKTNKRMPDYDYIRKELLRNGVSRKLLWTEYMEESRANGDEPVAMVLGDNIFAGHGLKKRLQAAVENAETGKGATVFGYYVDDPERFGIVEFDHDGKAISIEEKPEHPKSNYCVTGLYFYDNRVVEYAKNLKPSARGELEITDLNRIYLEDNSLNVELLGQGFTWLDTGTHESLVDATTFIKTVEQHQHRKIACLEEIAYLNGWISKEDVLKVYEVLKKNQYGQYLKDVLDGKYQEHLY